jgi:multiple sugar transport system permease protein
MDYLVSLPRRLVTVYLPVGAFLIVLLFPFYWMVITRSSRTMNCCRAKAIRSGSIHPDVRPHQKLLFDTDYPAWLGTRCWCR